jgi:hypothetical protein
MIVDLVKIENDIAKIHEAAIDDGKGFEWLHLAQYIGVLILEARIDQENNGIPISVIDLELAKLKGG